MVPTLLPFLYSLKTKLYFKKYSYLSPALRRPEFIDQSFLPNKLRSLDIFKKKEKVPSLYRDIHPGDS